MAYRPGGVLAAKLHLKHLAAATTEGYAARPGGAQAELLAEVNKLEADHKLQLVLTEFRNYQQGILPAGPAARSLTEFFATIDADLNTESTAAPKIQRNDHDILNLLSKRAKALHLGPRTTSTRAHPPRAGQHRADRRARRADRRPGGSTRGQPRTHSIVEPRACVTALTRTAPG
jgi:hypothetical protein